MSTTPSKNPNMLKKADWEIDFYSRPIIENDGKKRWELLITTTQDISAKIPFRWEKRCPASDVNSLWLSQSLEEALIEAKNQGWMAPKKLRCWRTSMSTMIKKAASKIDVEVVASRRTYSLFEWLAQRERDIYPKEEGYISGPIAPPPARILNQPIPLPDAMRGDAWAFASLPIETLRDATEWPMEFSSLLPIREGIEETTLVHGLRLFSKARALALAGWIGGLEPVKLVIQGNQLLLEAGQEDRWLVTDIDHKGAQAALIRLTESKEKADGLQFIAVQATPDEEKFTGFWMLRDLAE